MTAFTLPVAPVVSAMPLAATGPSSTSTRNSHGAPLFIGTDPWNTPGAPCGHNRIGSAAPAPHVADAVTVRGRAASMRR